MSERRRVVRGAVLVLVTLCFALGFGLNYGKSNQAFYLLGSVKRLHPELWSRDFVANARDYHPAYTQLGALILGVDPSGWSIAFANVASVCFGSWCCYRLARSLAPSHDAFIAFVLVLSLAAASGTNGAGDSYVFGDIFQPSTLGSVGLLGSALAFVRGRSLLAGLGLAFAGAFHANYLLLGLVVLGVAWLVAGERRWRDGAVLLGPAGLVLLAFLPLILASSESALASEARRIFQDVRLPHHFRVERFAADFLPFLGFGLLGAASLLVRARSGHVESRRLLALLCGFALLIVPAALLSSIGIVRVVNQLFAWRIAPHAILLSQVALACLAVRSIRDPAGARREAAGAGVRALLTAGVGCLLFAVLLAASSRAAWLGVVMATVSATSLFGSGQVARLLGGLRKPALLEFVVLATFSALSARHLSHLYSGSDLLGGKDRELSDLCAWLTTSTPRDAVVLGPPEEGELRFRCRRAVVIDWKSPPIIPRELLEWAHRIEEVTGRRPLRGASDLAGYAELDEERLARLRARYGVDVVVVNRKSAFAQKATPDFSSGRFAAFRLR